MENSAMTVKYERIERAQTPSMLHINFADSSIHDGKVQLFVSDSIVNKLGAQRVIPAPETSVVGNGDIAYTFLATSTPASVAFALQPDRPGVEPFAVQVPRPRPCNRALSSSPEVTAQPEHSMSTILHAIIGYFFLLLTVRVLTRRPGGQLTLFEFVIVFLIGGVIILATVGHDRSVTNCATAIITVGLMHRLVPWIKTKSPRLGTVIDGMPLVALKDGCWQNEVMTGMKLDPEDIMAAARLKGIDSIFGVKYAILERNGTISVIEAEEE
jgi:hypothetical protein